MSDVTQILSRIEAGDPSAAEYLLPLVYDDLRKQAAAKLSQETPGQTLQATALVHEAYLRLVDRQQVQQWDSRGHFFAAAAEAMRRILIDHARSKQSAKRGGKGRRVELENTPADGTASFDELVEFSDALDVLETFDFDAGKLVKLRYFAGLSVEEAAQIMGISRSTAYDLWRFARAWLRCELGNSSNS